MKNRSNREVKRSMSDIDEGTEKQYDERHR
jgi:hypothetical protein